MDYRIVISQTGEESYFENLNFLLKHWSLIEVENFIQKTETVKKVLEKQPNAFPVWEYDD